MKVYIALWKAKMPWTNLSVEERDAYIGPLTAVVKQVIENGAEIITWGATNGTSFNHLEYDFFAVWKFANDQMMHSFENMVVGTGWYNYFDQVNIMGDALTPQEVIGRMVEL